MLRLFFKECKYIFKSLIYFIFIGVLVLFYISQVGDLVGNSIKISQDKSLKRENNNELIKPEPGQDFYGTIREEIPEQIMQIATRNLFLNYKDNKYDAWNPFYKSISLNDKDQDKIKSFLNEITGLSIDEIADKIGKPPIPIAIEYDYFKSLMVEVDGLIGGNSFYEYNNLSDLGVRQMTYEERLLQYEELVYKDKITNAYARYSADYIGIVLAIFPVFVATSFILRDKRAHMEEIIYYRNISSLTITFIRYIALTIMMFIPVLLLSIFPTFQFINFSSISNIEIDVFAYIKVYSLWLLPTLMISCAIGVFFTELTKSPIAIIIQFIWWFIDINYGVSIIEGGYGKRLAIRHNMVGNLNIYKENFKILAVNRLFYISLALVIVLLSSYVLELKRRGVLNVNIKIRDIFKFNKVKSKA